MAAKRVRMGIIESKDFLSILILNLKKALVRVSITAGRGINLVIKKEFIVRVLFFLEKHCLASYKNFIELTAVDYITKQLRFELNYHLLSILYAHRICVKAFTADNILSVTSVFKGAGWAEREVWDMFGIFFFYNTDLRRILTDYGFQGFPLRKDFPLNGFVELRYDNLVKSVVYENLELTQEFRFYNFLTPWSQFKK